VDKSLILKDWHKPKDAAKILSLMFEMEVSEADIFQFVLDGKLSIYVNFVSPITIVAGKIDPEATQKVRLENDKAGKKQRGVHPIVPVWKVDSSFSNELNTAMFYEMKHRPLSYDVIGGGASYEFDSFPSETGGVCYLTPLGAGHHFIKRELERLTSKINVPIPKEPLYIASPKGTLGALYTRRQMDSDSELMGVVMREVKNKIFVANLKNKDTGKDVINLSDDELKEAIWLLPTNKLPEDSYFVIDSDSIMNLVNDTNGASKAQPNGIQDDGLVVHYAHTSIQEMANKAAEQYSRNNNKPPSKQQVTKILFDGGLISKKYGEPASSEYIERRFKKDWGDL